MIKSRIITYLPNDNALKWGLDLQRITSPICFVLHSSLKSVFDTIELNNNIEIVYVDWNEPLFFSDTLKLIQFVKSNTNIPTENYVFISDAYLYKYFSFEFIYSTFLLDYLEKNNLFNVDYCHLLPHDFFFYSIHSSLVFKLLNELKINEKNSNFHFTQNTYLTYKSDQYSNLNVDIAQSLESRVVHLIGDQHVLNTFTPNEQIGCRSHVLFNHQNDNGDLFLTHFLSEMTMVNFLKTFHLKEQLIHKLKVKENDICCFHLGELDVRTNFLKDNFPFDDALNLIPILIKKYIEKIKSFSQKTMTIPIVIGVPAPINGGVYHSFEYPYNGTLEQRLELQKAMNLNLIKLALENNINFYNPYQIYSSNNGLISINFSDNTVYLNPEFSSSNLDNLIKYIQSNLS